VDWWYWVAAGFVVAVVVLGVLRRGRQDDAAEEPVERPVVPPVRWTPYDYPMGPVSSWPHAVDRPEEVPSGSPADRSFPD